MQVTGFVVDCLLAMVWHCNLRIVGDTEDVEMGAILDWTSC
jgi:hypothetical protein